MWVIFFLRWIPVNSLWVDAKVSAQSIRHFTVGRCALLVSASSIRCLPTVGRLANNPTHVIFQKVPMKGFPWDLGYLLNQKYGIFLFPAQSWVTMGLGRGPPWVGNVGSTVYTFKFHLCKHTPPGTQRLWFPGSFPWSLS